MKRILIIAGPNGAGKTTFAREYLPQEADCPRFINADLIAAGLSPFDPDAAAIQAGRLMIEEMPPWSPSAKVSAIETTLSGRGYTRQIPEWQRLGYRVELIYLQLRNDRAGDCSSPERVAARRPSHPPSVIVRRRFRQELAQLRPGLYQAHRRLLGNCTTTPRSRRGTVERGLTRNEYESRTAKPESVQLPVALAALKRAAQKALEVARRTGTPCYVLEGGKLVDIAKRKPARRSAGKKKK